MLLKKNITHFNDIPGVSEFFDEKSVMCSRDKCFQSFKKVIKNPIFHIHMKQLVYILKFNYIRMNGNNTHTN